nr:chalcone isomerase-like protein [Ocimum tenuiflorum]
MASAIVPSSSNLMLCFSAENPNKLLICSNQSFNRYAAFRPHLRIKNNSGLRCRFSIKAASSSLVVSSEYSEEPQTKVKYQTSLSLPGCSSTLSLLGTGYREKVFAIIGVKVYAAGLYTNPSIFSKLDTWKGRSSEELQKDSLLFDAIYQAPLEKSLHIVLVRDLDGKTFWDALDEALSPRIMSPTPVDESALTTFRGIFQGRPLQKGTSIFLTWLDTEKLLVYVTPEGIPSSIDATIESSNVTSALYDVFLGGNPVSPTLKASVCHGLAVALK